jgi:hypothetical protein
MHFIKKNRDIVAGLVLLLTILYLWGVNSGKIEFMLGSSSYPWDTTATTNKVTKKVSFTTPSATDKQTCDPANFASVSLIPETNDVVRDSAFEFAPSNKMTDKNFLFESNKYGENTQGSSLRNANRQLRSEPANTRNVVSPWMNSTIEPDLLRRPLE